VACPQQLICGALKRLQQQVRQHLYFCTSKASKLSTRKLSSCAATATPPTVSRCSMHCSMNPPTAPAAHFSHFSCTQFACFTGANCPPVPRSGCGCFCRQHRSCNSFQASKHPQLQQLLPVAAATSRSCTCFCLVQLRLVAPPEFAALLVQKYRC
jgi:hypothetical protein